MSAIVPIILFAIPLYWLFRRMDHHAQIMKDSEEEK
jgi:hypothetical protein